MRVTSLRCTVLLATLLVAGNCVAAPACWPVLATVSLTATGDRPGAPRLSAQDRAPETLPHADPQVTPSPPAPKSSPQPARALDERVPPRRADWRALVPGLLR